MTLDNFLPYVLPDVPGCPSVTAKRAVIDAAMDFLTYSGIWREVQEPIPLTPDINEYDLDAPTGALCIAVRDIYTSQGSLRPVTLSELAQLLPNWQTATASAPMYYTRSFDLTTLRLYPMPHEPNGETITVDAVYTLDQSATSIPDVIVQRWRDVIVDGAKARLKSMSKVAWADPGRAVKHQFDFELGRSRAKVQALYDNTTGSLTVRPRRFGA